MPTVGRKATKNHTQSVVFQKKAGWTEESSRKWVSENDYYTDGLDETETQFRWRQYDPDDSKFDYRMKVIEKDSISLVLGILKERTMDYPIREDQAENEIERRTYPYLAEIRAEAGEGKKPVIEGVAAVYNEPTKISTWLGDYVEVIEEGFFEEVLGNDVRALWNHNTDLVLGRTKSRTLELQDRKDGLGTMIHPPDTQCGRDAVTSIQRGDVDQMSFAFTVKVGWDEWKEDEGGVLVRRLKRGACKQLYDVSPVSFPAYPQTSVAVRSKLQGRRQDGTGSRVGGGDQGIPPTPSPEQAQGRWRPKLSKKKINILLKE